MSNLVFADNKWSIVEDKDMDQYKFHSVDVIIQLTNDGQFKCLKNRNGSVDGLNLENVAKWMSAHQGEAAMLLFQFQLGASVGNLGMLGMSETTIQETYDGAIDALRKARPEKK